MGRETVSRPHASYFGTSSESLMHLEGRDQPRGPCQRVKNRTPEGPEGSSSQGGHGPRQCHTGGALQQQGA